jgi:hypothetical protein
MLRCTTPLITAAALTAGAALLTGVPAHAAAGSGDTAKTSGRPTPYAMTAFGYGSRVRGGQVPAGSDRSAFQAIGCTNLAGLSRTNAEASVDLGEGVSLAGVKTHVWTTKAGGSVSSWASHTIAKVTLASTVTKSLYLKGLSSTAHSWHDASGFHAATTATVAQVVLDTSGTRVHLPVPTAGHPTVVPGIVRISLGEAATGHSAHSASAALDALRLQLLGTDTTADLAHSSATLQDGVQTSLFSGSAYGTRAKGLQGSTSSGPTPLLVMSCVGTHGRVLTRKMAGLHLGDAAQAQALKVSERAGVRHGKATAYERAEVGRVKITHDLVVRAVAAQANVVRTSRGYRSDDHGTSIGQVLLDGRVLRIPASGVLRIAGVAKLESDVVHRTRRGIDVTGLEVTLLDGNQAVVDIAHAKVGVAPSGL